MQVLTESAIAGLPLLARGKVRDVYEIDAETLLIVTTDRMSAFDVIMNQPVPCKGVVLNQITLFWMRRFEPIIKNHLIEADAACFPAVLAPYRSLLEGRAVLARKARPLPLECIVRGNLTGTAWKEYRATGMVCGQRLPAGLKESERLAEAIFTPSTKAEAGRHDESISAGQAAALVGAEAFAIVRDASLDIFGRARDYAATRGIIIADTKFEFGLIDGEIRLIDEVLTPDSSRFWPGRGFAPGGTQPGFDKQYLRDWLEGQNWNKTPPPPLLPQNVIDKTGKKYREIYKILTGQALELD